MIERPTDPRGMGVADIRRALLARSLAAVDVIRCALDRAETLSRLRAWEAMDPDGALVAAEGLDRRIAAGTPIGLLAGAPIGVKDVIETAHLRTSAGSPLLSNHVPKRDAACVAVVRQADGIVVGKTTTTEFAYGDPAATLNPWDPGRTPGGSSSGSAVAVAAGIVPFALATQTSGSTLRPAAYNGVVGYKPQSGLIPTAGLIPLAKTFDQVGIIVRSIEDAGVAFAALTGAQVPAQAPPGDRAPVTIGLLRRSFIDNCDAETATHVEDVVTRLEGGRFAISEVDISPFYAEMMATFRVMVAVEAAAYHERTFGRARNDYGPRIAALVTRGLSVPAAEYRQAARELRRMISRFEDAFDTADVLMAATTPTCAPADRESTGDPNNLVAASASGLPAISIPSGLCGHGMPLGIQLIGRRGGDGRLLRIADRVERLLGFDAHPPCWDRARDAA